MKTYLNRFMSLLGYLPRDAVAAGVAALQVEIEAFIALKQDSMETGMKFLAATRNLERALSQSRAEQFAAAELAADETPALLLAEARKQTTLLEVLAKQGEYMWQYVSESSDPLRTAGLVDVIGDGPEITAPATGAAASGLSG